MLGTPVWANGPAQPVRQFLRGVDLSAASVAAFCTHGGGGGAGAFTKLTALIGAELIATLDLKNPKDTPRLDERLAEWVGSLGGEGD